MSNAYWISPAGDIIEVDDRHIQSIIKSPAIFGMTRPKITAIYRKHKEPMYSEGNAREEVLATLIKKGWVRVRYIPRQYSVTFQLSEKGGDWKYLVAKFAKAMKRTIPETLSANIINLSGESVTGRELQLYEIASGALEERRKAGTFAAFLNPVKYRRGKKK